MEQSKDIVYDRKKLIVVRAALIVIGAVLGATLLWQYFVYYPTLMRQEFQIVVIAVSGAVLATILGLSAKPFYRLIASIAWLLGKTSRTVGASGVTAVIAGLVVAGLVAFLFDVIIRRVLDVQAVRILADIFVFCCFAALCGYGFVKWISTDETEERASEFMPKGYLITASCFTDDRVFSAVELLSDAKLYDGALKALWKFCDDQDALNRLKLVTDAGAVTVIGSSKDHASAKDYVNAEAELAFSRRLKPVCAEGVDAFPFIDGAASLSLLASPDDGVIERLRKRAQNVMRGGDVEANLPCENSESDKTSLTNSAV